MSPKDHELPFAIGALLALHAAEDAASEQGDHVSADRLAAESEAYFEGFVAHRPQTTLEAVEALRLAFYIAQCGGLEDYDREAVEGPIREAVRLLEADALIAAWEMACCALDIAAEPDDGLRNPVSHGVDVDLIGVLRNAVDCLERMRAS